jgi:hypothetical protein
MSACPLAERRSFRKNKDNAAEFPFLEVRRREGSRIIMKDSSSRSVFTWLFIAGFAMAAGSPSALAWREADPQQLMLADFNSGKKPNNNGQSFGAWRKEYNDETQFTDMSFVKDDARDDAEGYAVRLDYDVDSSTPAYNGFWMNLEGIDLASYRVLNFYIKGVEKDGFTKKVRIEFKDESNKPSASYFMVTKITGQWQKISVPFEEFQGTNDWENLRQFVIVFDDADSDPKVGSILIDEISLSKTYVGKSKFWDN